MTDTQGLFFIYGLLTVIGIVSVIYFKIQEKKESQEDEKNIIE